ncbi:MAG TPA: DUF1595 domain-containing protein, partial [Polyangia bacterium]|nr:DUF1595 domain-containing protein [Polyangia bacterium]
MIALGAIGSVGAWSLGGCTGKISGAGAGGAPGAAKTPTGPGTAAPPGPTGGPGNTFIDQDSPALERLTNVEYSQTVSDVLGEPAGAATRYALPVDPTQHGFDDNVALLQISSAHAQSFADAAAAIATAALADPTRHALVTTCDLSTGAACLQTTIESIGRRLYRRPLTDDEVSGFVTLAAAGASATDANAGAEAVVEAMLQSPHFLYRVQLGAADPSRAGIVGLTGYEMATRLSYLLLGTTPSDALLDQAAAGALDTTDGVGKVVQQMLVDPLARRGVKRFYAQWLPLDEISGPTADSERVPHMGDT